MLRWSDMSLNLHRVDKNIQSEKYDHYYHNVPSLCSDYSACCHLVVQHWYKLPCQTKSLTHIIRWKLAWDKIKCTLLNAHDFWNWYNATYVFTLPCTDVRSLFTISRKCTPHMNILHCSFAHTRIHSSTSYPISEIKTNGINGKAETTFAVLVFSLKSPNHETTSSYELICPVTVTTVSFCDCFRSIYFYCKHNTYSIYLCCCELSCPLAMSFHVFHHTGPFSSFSRIWVEQFRHLTNVDPCYRSAVQILHDWKEIRRGKSEEHKPQTDDTCIALKLHTQRISICTNPNVLIFCFGKNDCLIEKWYYNYLILVS